ncbi:MAG: cyclic nucleotide-binding domain-containing protein [Bacteroidota bacterium]
MLEALASISLFEGFDLRQLELIQPLFESYRCEDGTLVFEQGDQAEYLYLILEGGAVIQYKPYDSPAIIVSHLRAGDAFGWSALVGKETYSSAIVSVGDLSALRIRGDDLLSLCREHPTTGTAILNRLARGVSGRWKDAHIQVKIMLRSGLDHPADHEMSEP